MSPEVARWLSESVVYLLAGSVAVFLAVVRLCEGSKRIGDALGPVGRWLHRRYMHNEMMRREDRIQEYREALLDENSKEYLALQRRCDALYKMVTSLERDAKQSKKVERANAANWDMTSEYLRYDAQYHMDAVVQCAEQGLTLPTHRSYTQFCQEYRRIHGGQKYGRRWYDNPTEPPNTSSKREE